MKDTEIFDYGFHLRDRQLGMNVTVNGINVYTSFNADLIDEPEITPAALTPDLFKKIGKSSHIINKYTVGNNGLKLSFYIGGETYQEAQMNCNNLVAEFQNDIVTLKIGDTDFEYVGTVSGVSIKYTSVDHFYKLTLTFTGVKRLPLVTLEFTDEEKIKSLIEFWNSGAASSGLKITFRVWGYESGVYIDVNCNDNEFQISNVAGTPMYYIIDGIDGKLVRGWTKEYYEEAYTNVFERTNNFYEFPTVNRGLNKLKLSIPSIYKVDWLKIEYYPVFLI